MEKQVLLFKKNFKIIFILALDLGSLGFCDHRKLFEKQLKEKADELSKQN